MPHRRLIVVTLLAASCSPSGAGNESSASPAASERTLVLTATSSAAGQCSYLWNGEAVTEQGILDKSVAAIGQAIDDAGGIDKLTDEVMPLVSLAAAAEVPYACTGPALRQLGRAGSINVALKPAGASGHRVKLLIEPGSTGPFAIIRVNKDGMSWDDRPIDQAGLRERVRSESQNRPPVELIVAPDADSTFLPLREALVAVKQGGMEAVLSGCAGTTGPVREPDPVC